MTDILLDTNAYSHLLRGDEGVQEFSGNAENVFLSVIVLGELYAGFQRGSKRQRNLETLKRFLQKPQVHVLELTERIAERFGQIHAYLRRIGKPIPTNDLWIASQTMNQNATLVTYDRHFLNVPELAIWKELN
ncbi:MAG: type II toxin-antitoxin system VapC family toxin [Phycisphaerae bacterium]